ncbi:DUF29 domain-containing protein [Propylenella binzhouense]|uniref:DUF29 domain-containing protein n=1 Tax=Propylenella binzhouense TaxID=2555902 RepID=A0A964WV50_9HYPH|nr:DUF29 domain-containing protein [Propylenella binzhouense]MYZ49791.1 DUF29 domain-containing protein [Propylenella binzhouense]
MAVGLTSPRADAAPYEFDFPRWAEQQARALRARNPAEIDWDNVAEEIESLGRNDRRAIAARLEVLIAHLLKCLVQPERRTRSWDLTIQEQRKRIALLIERSPSLADFPARQFEEAYREAVRLASRDTGLAEKAFPAAAPFSADQALSPDFVTGSRDSGRDVRA